MKNPKDNIIPFHSQASIEKEQLRRVAYEANGIEDVLDLLKDRVESTSSFEISAYTLMSEKINRILHIAGSMRLIKPLYLKI